MFILGYRGVFLMDGLFAWVAPRNIRVFNDGAQLSFSFAGVASCSAGVSPYRTPFRQKILR